jgi:pre-mRNA cleavage complex 2 protein Pcf11
MRPQDWINDVPSDTKGKGDADGHRRLSAKAAAAAEVAKRDAELRAQFVVVPPGDEAKTISCPICKETLKSEFLEDDEEWVWKNAVMKDDRVSAEQRHVIDTLIYLLLQVYHATCHAEAVVSTNTLAARLRTELLQRSRSGTPEVQSLRSTPPRATASGLKPDVRRSGPPTPESNRTVSKRKIDSDLSLRDTAGDDGTPPFKKMALTV